MRGLLYLVSLVLGVCGSMEILPMEMHAFVSKNIAKKSIAVLLHVNWCGACKRTLPNFMDASKLLPHTAMATIDVTDSSDFVKSLEISGFPALRVLPKGSDPNTPFIRWVTVPYYSRDVSGIVNFVRRVDAPSVREGVDGHLLTNPEFGHMQSLVIVGDLSLVPVEKLKLRFQLLHAAKVDDAGAVHGLGKSCSSMPIGGACIAVVPSGNALVTASPVEYPVALLRDVSESANFESWLTKNSFPGVWSVDDGRFQFFNDQNVFKVLIAQDPASPRSAAVNASIIAEISSCMHAVTGRVSFGFINGVSFKQALGDFDIPFESGNVKVLVLTDEGLDFTRYFDQVQVGELCSGLEKILTGNTEMKTRGNWFAKIIARLNGWLKFVGIESEWLKITLGFTLGCAVAVALAVIFLRNIDDAIPPAARALQKSKDD